MNMNKLAVQIAKLEGKKKELSIAQIKEVLAVLAVLIKKDPCAVLGGLLRYSKRK